MEYNKKLQKVILLYIKKHTSLSPFLAGKPSPFYWKVRKELINKDPDKITILYNFLSNSKEESFATIEKVIKMAEDYQREQLWEKLGYSKTEPKDYSLEELLRG